MNHRNSVVQFYQSKNGQWRWRLKAGNSRIICNPGESFTRRRDAVRNFRAVYDALHICTVELEGAK